MHFFFSQCTVEHGFSVFSAMKVFVVINIFKTSILFVILSCRFDPEKPRWPVHPQLESQRHQRSHRLLRKNLSWQSFLERSLQQRREPPSLCPKITEEEIMSYRFTGCTSAEENPLAWWRNNEHKYPHIVKLARRYLTVPGPSVPSERVFSTAGDIVTASRSHLLAENVDKLIFLQKNLIIE